MISHELNILTTNFIFSWSDWNPIVHGAAAVMFVGNNSLVSSSGVIGGLPTMPSSSVPSQPEHKSKLRAPLKRECLY